MYLKKTLQALAITWMLLWGTQWISQTQNKINTTKQQTTEVLSENHQQIINTPIQEIIKTHGIKSGMELIRKHLIIEINSIRKKNNLQELKKSPELTQVAEWHAKYLNDHYDEYFDVSTGEIIKKKDPHIQYGPKNQELSANDRIKKNKTYKGSLRTGEIIAINTKDINKSIDGWLHSPHHKAIIMDKFYDTVGIWISTDKYIWVVDFWAIEYTKVMLTP